jgi:hypothetical protein
MTAAAPTSSGVRGPRAVLDALGDAAAVAAPRASLAA